MTNRAQSSQAASEETPSRYRSAVGHLLGMVKWGFFAFIFLELFGQATGRMSNGRCVCPLCMALNVVPPQVQTPAAPASESGDGSST
ncbi:MAG: hypothetical protein SNJ74_10790 [Fimbriimonadaceae bacterium]